MRIGECQNCSNGGISPEAILAKAMPLFNLTIREPTLERNTSYNRPWGGLLRVGEGGVSTVQANKNKFCVDLDVQQFSPEEISVKVVDRFVIVEGKHEEKQDEHGWISRQFTRKYMIPEQCDIDEVTSKLSSDGVLTITAPRKQSLGPEGERVINIEHTGKPAVHESQNEAKEEEENTK